MRNWLLMHDGLHDIHPDCYSSLPIFRGFTMYNSSDEENPFGFFVVKCPYSVRDITPVEAAAESHFTAN